MFSKDIYVQRRETLKTKLGSGLILLMGNEEVGMNFAHNGYHFRQDSTFLYYVGIDQPSLTVIIDIDNDKTILFGNELTIDDIVWTGPLPPLTELAADAGITEVRPASAVANYLQTATSQKQTIHYLPPYRGEHYLKLLDWLQISPAEADSKKSVSLIQAVVSMRSYKQPEEIAEIEKAIDISTEMHETFMRLTKEGVRENYIAGIIEGVARSNGGNLSFPTILTVNGETLHIHARDVVMHDGQLALCDAGAETAMHYAGDLTRTMPVSKKFTDIQKQLYNTVLNAQLAAIEACKPGVLFRDVHTLAGEKLLEGLNEVGIVKGDVREALANDVHTLFFQCGLGHMMGLDVHDMENLGEQYVGYTDSLKKGTTFGWKSLRLGRALEPGFVVTVEPGLYFIPTLIDMWKAENRLSQFVNYTELDKFRGFGGIRIEDDVLVTTDGPRVLGSHTAPKTVEEIENFS
ncbi:MAG: aminopeptidase P family protein [Niabella sp.]